jgi:hypothetical protein
MRTLTGPQGKALMCAYLDRLARNTLDENVRRIQRPITRKVLASLQDQFPALYALCLVEPGRAVIEVKGVREMLA